MPHYLTNVSFSHKYLITSHIPPAESVQQSLERMFGKAGGRIPITPTPEFERAMGVSRQNCTYFIHQFYSFVQFYQFDHTKI